MFFGWMHRHHGHEHHHHGRHGRGRHEPRSADAQAIVVLRALEEQLGTPLEIVQRLEKQHGEHLGADEVYPLLQYLEDRGFIAPEPIGDKKAYAVTEAGFAFLAEAARPGAGRGQARGGRHAFHDLGFIGLLVDLKHLGRQFKHELRRGRLDEARLVRIREILERTRRDLDAVLHAAPDHGLA